MFSSPAVVRDSTGGSTKYVSRYQYRYVSSPLDLSGLEKTMLHHCNEIQVTEKKELKRREGLLDVVPRNGERSVVRGKS